MAMNFIDPRGGTTTFKLGSPSSMKNDPRTLTQEQLTDQMLIAEEIKNTRGLSPQEQSEYDAMSKDLTGRQQTEASSYQQQLRDMFGGGTGAVAGGATGGSPVSILDQVKQYGEPQNTFDQQGYEQQLASSAQTQRQTIADLIKQQLTSAGTELKQQFAPQYEQVASEQAARGRLGSGVSAANFGNLRQQQSNALADAISRIGQSGLQQQIGVESDLANRLAQGKQFGATNALSSSDLGLRRMLGMGGLVQNEQERNLREKLGMAGLYQGESQFGRTFGLQSKAQSSGERESALGRQLGQRQLDIAENLGRLQAQSSGSSGIGEFGGLMQGLGGFGQGIAAIGGMVKGGFDANKKKEVNDQYGTQQGGYNTKNTTKLS